MSAGAGMGDMRGTDNPNATCYGLMVNPEFVPDPNAPTLADAIPMLVMQIALSMASNMGFNLALEPVHIPRIVPDMLGGFVISPVVLDSFQPGLGKKLWPKDKVSALESLVNLGFIFAMFIAGMNARVPPLSQLRKRTGFLAFLATIFPMVVGAAIILPLLEPFGEHDAPKTMFYWAGLISGSSFVSLIPSLTRLKLVYTDLGREALSVGMINELWSWFWVVMVITVSARHKGGVFSVLAFIIIFTVLSFVVVGPAVRWITKSNQPSGTGDQQNIDPATINIVLFLVLACALMSEMFGACSLFGAFTLGLAMPSDLLSTTVLERMDDCVNGVLMPLFYSLCGIRLNFDHLIEKPLFWTTLIVPFVAKTVSCFLATLFVKNMTPRDAVGLGLVTSTKGLLSLVMILVGMDRKHLPLEAYTELWLSILVSSTIVAPLMSLLYGSGGRNNALGPYVHRTVEGVRPGNDFRILANVHSSRDVPGIMNLLEISDIAPTCPISLFALRTVELIGRGTSIFIFHDSGRTNSSSESSSSSWTTAAGANPALLSRKSGNSDQSDQRVISAFKMYAVDHDATTNLRSMTIVCPDDRMHEEICNVAEFHQAAILILPYHKQQTMDGQLEDSSPEFGPVNLSTMDSAPCSVALLVDKGFGSLPLGKSSELAAGGASNHGGSRGAGMHSGSEEIKLGMIYIGGPDDREALTLSWRLAAHHRVNLTVIRFLVGDNPLDVEPMMDFFAAEEDVIDEPFTVLTESDKEKEIDGDFINSFLKITKDDTAIQYVEKVSNSGEETVGILRAMEHNFDLYVVGRGRSVLSPLTAGLAEWSDSPELGAIGDVLVNSDFCSHVSVLVVQQHISARSIHARRARHAKRRSAVLSL